MGFLFYELATLKHPFGDDKPGNMDEWKQAHLYKVPKVPISFNSDLSMVMTQTIMKMIEKSKTRRFATWEDISQFLEKDTISNTSVSPLIDVLVQKKMEKDKKLEQEQLEEEKEKKERIEFVRLINSQFEQQIKQPLQEFIDEFNNKHVESIMELVEGWDDCEIYIENKYLVGIAWTPIFEEDFYKGWIDKGYSVDGEREKVFELPKLRDRGIMAWGTIKSASGKGYNILLAEVVGDIYGEWMVLVNTNFSSVRKDRLPEPFCFELKELEEEIKHIDTTHTFVMTYNALNVKLITSLFLASV